jgi:hypothetical protein
MARGFGTCPALVIFCTFGDPIAHKLPQIGIQGLSIERHLLPEFGRIPFNLLNQVTLVGVAARYEVERRRLPTRDVHKI